MHNGRDSSFSSGVQFSKIHASTPLYTFHTKNPNNFTQWCVTSTLHFRKPKLYIPTLARFQLALHNPLKRISSAKRGKCRNTIVPIFSTGIKKTLRNLDRNRAYRTVVTVYSLFLHSFLCGLRLFIQESTGLNSCRESRIRINKCPFTRYPFRRLQNPQTMFVFKIKLRFCAIDLKFHDPIIPKRESNWTRAFP